MSKAIVGAIEIGAAFAATAWVGGIGGLAAIAAQGGMIGLYTTATVGLAAAGIMNEAGALAQALGSNQGLGVTTRSPAAFRQIIRGVQRTGGTIVFSSTTGSTKRQYNLVIVLATHVIDAIENLYLDGRQVFWQVGSHGNFTRNGVNFGGTADPGTFIGPNGVKYSFGSEVFCYPYFGDQNATTGYSSDLHANDGTWAPSTVSGGGGASASATFNSLSLGEIDTIVPNNLGLGYPTGSVAISIYDAGGAGTGASGHGVAVGGQITSYVVDAAGSGYVNPQIVVPPPTTSTVTPYLGGCAWVYLKLEADSGTFPQFPEIRFTVRGKNNIYDPRTAGTVSTTAFGPNVLGVGTAFTTKFTVGSTITVMGETHTISTITDDTHMVTDVWANTYANESYLLAGGVLPGASGYTSNWALNVADMITDPVFGVGDRVNQDQLIAAANVCDEQVACAAGSESRYSLHWHYDTSVSPGDAIEQMMSGAMGRVSHIAGEWYIWPAYWQGPSFSFDANALAGPIQWMPKRSLSELCNRVSGTYIAANYPYNVAGDLYDSNGYFQGQTQNNFPFGFQPSNFPMYAADALHGYGAGVDVYLTQDGGIVLPRELSLPGVLSISQAQRLAKISMMRNRQQGTGVFPMGLTALRMQPIDVMQFSFSALGWTNKILEIAGESGQEMKVRFAAADGDSAPSCTVLIPVNETDPSVYEWDEAEELTAYDIPVLSGAVESWIVAPPTTVAAVSDLATALVQLDGTVLPRIEVTWVEPADTYVQNGGSIEIQICAHSSAAWQTALLVGGQATAVFLGNVVSGSSYDVRLRAVRSNGAQSVWVEVDNILCGFAIVTSDAVAPAGTLTTYATGLTATIAIANFTATANQALATCTPSPATLTGLNQAQNYWVYYIDTGFAGGTITPIATQVYSDFANKPGYYLIGQILTATATPVFRPSSFIDLGTTAANSPQFAYDTNPNTQAEVNGLPSQGDCQWIGFSPYTTGAAKTLNVVTGGCVFLGTGSTGQINMIIAGVSTTLVTHPASSTTYTGTIPSGTNLATVVVEVTALGGTGGIIAADVGIQDIYIQ